MGANGEVVMMEESIKMTHSRDALRALIAQWNANRLDLFEISEPNDEGEFQGVMRFYFQEAGAKVATKCVRISSTATTKAVIETLVEKFRPDMRMLSIPQYALYEIHENGDERRLGDTERPLFVQLNWHSDDREGRFLLKRMDEQVREDFYTTSMKDGTTPTPSVVTDGFKRKLSKREKKQLKKLQEKAKNEKAATAAEKLYNELPETSFTRSISNPEAVMRRRRQQKLEKKLAQFRSRDGGPDTGGTLKIYGQSLCEDVPYKTLLLSVNDTAAYVVKEMLVKYGVSNQDPQNYCLVQVCEREGESILDDDESPLSILMNQPNDRGSIMFHVRRRPPDFHPRKRKKKPGRRGDEEGLVGYRGSYDGQLEPILVELLPDGSETGRRIALESDVMEVGSEWGGLQLAGLRPRHCVVANTEGIVTMTPSSRDSDVYINGQRIYETTMLQHGTIIRFGRTHYFRFSQRNSPTGNRTFNEREMLDSVDMTGTGSGGGVGGEGMANSKSGSSMHSPAMSPVHDDSQRAIRPDSILPATLELPEAGEDAFLSLVVVNVLPATLQFKLSPTYAIYLAARYRATTHFRPDANPHERAHFLSTFLLRVSHLMLQTVQERNTDANSLAFWMANSSELLHFLKSDRQIGAFSLDAQDILAEVVQLSFRHLATCIQGELANLIGQFFLEREEDDENATAPILGILGSTMTLLRRSRVNAALTIQLFSQVFHFINMAVFNKLIGIDGRAYCSRRWGNLLRRRINRIETWAEKQGLELAADCHLVRIIQAAHLLNASKNTPEEVASAASSCFKLNSLQLRCLLMKYQYETDEVPIAPEILENVVRVAESTVDDVIRADGRHIRVEEEPLLGLAFLLPEDGYSCDIVRGIPTGLVEFLSPLSPVCRLTPNPNAAGYWTIFFHDPMRSPSAMSGRSFATAFNNIMGSGQVGSPQTPGSVVMSDRHSFVNHNSSMNMCQMNMSMPMSMSAGSIANNQSTSQVFNATSSTSPPQHLPFPTEPHGAPEVQTIKLQKISGGLGLSIIAAKALTQDKQGIYIKSVVKNGSADVDGRLATGDQLLSVEGHSLVGISQDEAAKYLMRTGPVVTLEVAKQAAVFHGIASALNQPSPDLVSRVPTVMNTNLLMPPPRNLQILSQHVVNKSHMHIRKQDALRCVDKEMLTLAHTPPTTTTTTNTTSSTTTGVPTFTNLTDTIIDEDEDDDEYEEDASSSSIINPDRRRSLAFSSSERETECGLELCEGTDEELVDSSYWSSVHSSGSAGYGINIVFPEGLPQHYRGEDQNEISSSRILNPGFPPNSSTLIRSAQSDSSLARWKSFEALSRKGLSETCLREATVVGSSRLMKFFNSCSKSYDEECTSSTTGSPHGFSASRRMSERDLSSKGEFVDHGVNQLPPGHPLLQPRIHSSKSVPSLNSDHHPPTTVPPPMVRSPGYPGNMPYAADPNLSQQQRSYFQHYPSASMTMDPMAGARMHPAEHPRSRSIQSLAEAQYRHDMVNKQPSTPTLHQQTEEPERFYQNVGFYPPPPPPPSHSSSANVPIRTYIPYSNSTGNISSSGFRSPVGQHQPMPYYPGANLNYPGSRPHVPNVNSASVPGNLNWPRAPGQPGINRDLLRQEAKMLEMQDELRRREERAAIMMSKVQQNRYGPPGAQQRPMYPGGGQRPLSSSGLLPMGKPYYGGMSGGGRVPMDSQEQFSASMGGIPKGAFSYNNGAIPKSPSIPANPWDREAKEVEAGRKKEAAKYWRDQHIQELESLPNRTSSQDDQMRALKLEREFQRRAEEIKKDDDGENEEEEEEHNERKAMIKRLQEDLERTKISGPATMPTMNGGGKADPLEEDRLRKIEEMRRKKMELEAAQAAEERLVREAGKRREEEMKRQMQQHCFPYQSPYRTSLPTRQPGSPVTNSPYLENQHQLSPTMAGAPPLPKSPPPSVYKPPIVRPTSPEKAYPPQVSPRPKSDKKTVSFNETVATNEPPPSPPARDEPTERIREDPNKFFTEATAMLSSPRSPDTATPGTGNTPGVIGAQEVYRDPRMRRLAEQQQKQPITTPKPEKLSFKEKMKMFAMESGEIETPKDKVKISKAQRELEVPPSAAAPANATGNAH